MSAKQPRTSRWLPRPAGWLGRGRVKDSGTEAAASKVAIVTDSTVALSDELEPGVLGHEGLRVVATPVMIGEHIFDEGKDDVLEPLAMAFAEGGAVKTSRPSPGAFERTYRELAKAGYTDIVSIHLSSDLSGTVDSAKLAAQAATVPVTIVDTRSVASGAGLAVLAALKAADSGKSAAEVAQVARTVAADSTLLFLVPSLDYLRKGGRISVAAGFFGQLLDVKPLLKLVEGHIVPIEKVRSNSKAMNRLATLALGEDVAEGGIAVVHYFGKAGEPTEQARQLGMTLASTGGMDVRFVPMPAVLAAHAGPGVIAVVVSKRGAPLS